MGEKSNFKVKKADYLLAVILIILFLAPVISSYNNQKSGLKAVISTGQGEEYVDLSHDGEIILRGMKAEVRNNSIYIKDSDCPHGICRHSGAISRPGEIIVCVPNKTVIEIRGNKTDTGFDAVAY